MIPLAIFIGLQGTKFEPLPWQPDVLRKAADDADNHIKSNERKAIDEGVSITTYDVKAQWIKAKIDPVLYRTEIKWMPSLFPEKVKRGPVEVFTVTDLKASSGLGSVAIDTANPLAIPLGMTPGSTNIGRRWTIVTGLIPVKKQLDLYVSTFSSSVYTSPDRDTPAYFFYDVERAEVVPDTNPNDLEWKELDVFDAIKKDQILWAGSAADPIDPTFLAPFPGGQSIPMAYPLPPVPRRFGEEVTHPPTIPMLTDTQMEDMQIQEKMQKKQIEEMLIFDKGTILKNSPYASVSGNEAELARQRKEAEEIPAITVTDYLFRFFDFTVEIGKTYRYRVRLYLANPNGSLSANLLEDDSLSKAPYLITEFSVPSNQVTIPLGARILSSAVYSPTPRSPEPAVSLYVIYFDMKDGSEWYVEKERVFRGQTVNYRNQDVTPFVNKAKLISGIEGEMPGSPPPTAPGGRRPPGRPTPTSTPPAGEKMTVDLVSEVCVLDMLGGNLLPNSANAPVLRSPGKVLVLEPSGAVLLRKVTTDLVEIDRLKNPASVGGFGMGGFGGSGMDSGPGMERSRL